MLAHRRAQVFAGENSQVEQHWRYVLCWRDICVCQHGNGIFQLDGLVWRGAAEYGVNVVFDQRAEQRHGVLFWWISRAVRTASTAWQLGNEADISICVAAVHGVFRAGGAASTSWQLGNAAGISSCVAAVHGVFWAGGAASTGWHLRNAAVIRSCIAASQRRGLSQVNKAFVCLRLRWVEVVCYWRGPANSWCLEQGWSHRRVSHLQKERDVLAARMRVHEVVAQDCRAGLQRTAEDAGRRPAARLKQRKLIIWP